MRILRILTFSTIKMFVRNRQAMFFTFFMPLVIMTVFGLIGFNRLAKIDVGVALSGPPTAATSAVINQFKQVPAFNIHEGIEPAERQAIENADRSVVLLVPFDLIPDNPSAFSAGLKTITMLTNAGQAQQVATVTSILNQILDKTTLNLTRAPTLFKLNQQEINAYNLKYIDFLLPGLVALAVMQMSVFSVAFLFANYKEKGILKRLIATPMRPYQFVTANVITRLMVTIIQASILVLLGVFIFKAHVIGSYWLVLLIVMLGSIMFLGLGFTISGIASTVETVPALANLIVFPMLFLGDTFFPISSMPDWLQKIAHVLPLTYFAHSLREVMTKNAHFSDVSSELLKMLIWAVILVITSNITFRFEEKRI